MTYGLLLRNAPMDDDALTFLLRDDFWVNDAAPIASPRTCEPGPGTLTATQTDGQFSISAGALQVPAQTTPAWGALNLYDIQRVRSAGLSMLVALTLGGDNASLAVGWDSNALGQLLSDAFEFATLGNLRVYDGGFVIPASYAASTAYKLASVLRTRGAYHLVHGVDGWRLMWVGVNQADANVYAGLAGHSNTAEVDTFRVADLAANGYGVWGERDLDVTALLTSPASGTAFDCTADVLLHVEVTTLPGAGANNVYFRRTDGSNTYYLIISSAGGYGIYRMEGGTPTLLGAAGGLINGDVLDVVALDDAIMVYKNGSPTPTLSFSGQTFNISQAGGSVVKPSGDLNVTARTLNGVANLSSVNHPGPGLADDALAGPVAEGSTFTHLADFLWDFQLDALSSINTAFLEFRIQDAANYWEILLYASGAYYLREIVGGSATSRAGAGAGTLSGGERLVIVADDEKLEGHYDNTLAWNYSAAANFKTATAGRAATLGASPALISNLTTRPRYPGGQARQALNLLGA